MRFQDLIGQRAIAQGLIRSKAEGRLPHALMFLGPGGNGALPLAQAFATFLNCEAPEPDDACGTCPSCQKAAKFIHPDIHYSYPFVSIGSGPKSQQKHKASDWIVPWRSFLEAQPYGSYEDWMNQLDDSASDGTGNKQGNIPREEVQDIQRRLQLKAFEDRYKILILWLPEYLGNEGNRLLKLIEEPPEKTLFILVAEDAERILPTILSRTQIVRVPRFSDESIAQALQKNRKLSEEQARRIALRSEGSYREALMLIQDDSDSDERAFRDWVDMVAAWQLISLYRWLEEFNKLGREKQKHWFTYGLQCVRTAYLCSLNAAPEGLPADHPGRQISELLSPEGWEQMAAALEKSAFYLSRNAHTRLVLMNLSIRLSRGIQEHRHRIESESDSETPPLSKHQS